VERLAASLLAASLLSVPVAAYAQTSTAGAETPTGSPTSEQLFFQGRDLMAQHRYQEACVVFEHAEKLRVTIGVLLNLADCYEQTQRPASALGKFKEATVAAHLANDAREAYAQQRATTLESRVPKLTIDTSTLKSVTGAEVLLDGRPLDDTTVNSRIAADPGRHIVQVTAPSKKPWSMDFDLAASMTVSVPPLQNTQGVAAPEHQMAAPVTDEGRERPADRSIWNARNVTSLALVAAGTVSVGLGVFFGLQSQSENRTANGIVSAALMTHGGDGACTGRPSGDYVQKCPSLSSARDAQNRDAVISDVFYVAGGALALGAIATWLLWPKPPEAPATMGQLVPQLNLRPDGGSILLRAGFR
jgi:hypothetical protein